MEVAPRVEWPEGAYVERRRQMNSAIMLRRLESIYALAIRPPTPLISGRQGTPARKQACPRDLRRNSEARQPQPCVSGQRARDWTAVVVGCVESFDRMPDRPVQE